MRHSSRPAKAPYTWPPAAQAELRGGANAFGSERKNLKIHKKTWRNAVVKAIFIARPLNESSS
jgi:hypothetical protein